MSTQRRFVVFCAATALLLSPAAARAQSPYELDRPSDTAWLASGLVLCTSGALAYFKLPFPALPTGTTPDVRTINGFDRSMMEPYHEDHLGDALLLTSCVLPFSLVSRSDVKEDADALALMWFEAALINQGLVFISKSLVQRPRPYTYDTTAPLALTEKRDSHLSFYSGHTSWSAMNCFYTATVFSDYSDNRDAETAVWIGAVAYSALTGFARVSSGHHFVTDAITGFVVGAAIGHLVPRFHRTDRPATAPAATPSQSLKLGFTVSF
jgi:membrane-associated phospholipid phosphatase